MKKYSVFILVLVVIAAFALVGCEKKQSVPPPVSQPVVTPAPVPDPVPAPAPPRPAPAKPAKK